MHADFDALREQPGREPRSKHGFWASNSSPKHFPAGSKSSMKRRVAVAALLAALVALAARAAAAADDASICEGDAWEALAPEVSALLARPSRPGAI